MIPSGYATYLNNFALKLHAASPDFFVLPAGLDASAKNTATTMDEATFLKKMLTAEPNLFDNLNGWVSHSVTQTRDLLARKQTQVAGPSTLLTGN